MTRKLNTKYTLEKKVDMVAKNIKHSMHQELLYNLCLMTGWHGTSVSYQQLDEVKEWIETNKLGEVRWYDIRWYDNRIAFEQSKDYEWFILRWS